MKVISIATWVLVVAGLAVATGWTFLERHQYQQELTQLHMEQQAVMEAYHAVAGSMSQVEAAYVMAELDRHAAGDCVIEPTKTGWVCIQRDGKRFYVRRP